MIKYKYHKVKKWGLGIGDWGLGIGDWAQSPITNPQSPIPNPHLFNFKIYLNIQIINIKFLFTDFEFFIIFIFSVLFLFFIFS